MKLLSSKRYTVAAWVFCLLWVFTMVWFGATLRYPTLNLDDPKHIFENPALNPVTGKSFLDFWRSPYFSLYIPVTYSFWAAIGAFGIRTVKGVLESWPFHWATLILHWGCACVVYLLVQRLASRRSIDDKTGIEIAGLCAAISFLIHPLQVEPVAWVSGTKDTLSAFLSLSAVLSFVCGLKFLAPMFFVLAILSKPTAVVLPLALAVFLWWWEKDLKALKPLLYWGLIALPFAILAKWLQPDGTISNQISFFYRPLVVVDALVFYCKKILVPWPLVLDYARHPREVLATREIFFSAIVGAIGVLGISLVKLRGAKAGIFAALVLFIPVSGLVPFAFQKFSTVADRYAYLPLAFFFLGLALSWLEASKRVRGMSGAIHLLLLVGFAFLTLKQVKHWARSETLFLHTLKYSRKSLLVHTNYAFDLFQAKRTKEAIFHLKKSVELEPKASELRMSLGAALFVTGQRDEAVRELKKAVELNPSSEVAQRYLAKAIGG